MTLTLRTRIVLALIPMFGLLAALGGTGVVLLHRLSDRIDAILRENYHSVNYMERLNEALERIDSSFSFALAGRSEQARSQYEANWDTYRVFLAEEEANITVAGERELVARLGALTRKYRVDGDAFFSRSANDPQRSTGYLDRGGLLDQFKEVKTVSADIRRINQEQMEKSAAEARSTADFSTRVLTIGLAVAALLAGLVGWYTVRSILQPIRSVTASAREISAGNLDQVMPVASNDEVGELAQAFNVMARHLREYRRSQLDQLLRARETSQATIDSFPDPVLVIDGEGRVEMANPAARRLLGVVPAPRDKAAASWQPPEPLKRPLAEALSGRSNYLPESFGEAIVMGSGPTECSMLPRILTIRDRHDNTLGAAVLLQDVTRLRLLDQVKNDLVATASHELKTPLTGIRLAVHLLLEETVGPLTPKQLELLLDARENSERLLAVVNNLLDLARLEQGNRQLDLRSERPRAILQAAADAIAARAHDKEIEIAVNVPDGLPAVSADPERIGHALNNLLDNALNYTDRGGRITLSATAEADEVVLEVVDTGWGIPAEHLPRVFEKFFRVPVQGRSGGTGQGRSAGAGAGRSAGTGLGLAIVREIVTAHGGTVTCESRVGAGTTFRIRLPAAKSEAASHYVGGACP